MAPEQNISSDLEDRLNDRHQIGHTGILTLSDDEVYVDDSITLNGRNLPANEPIDIVWHTAEGSWGILADNEVVGPQFHQRIETIRTVSTDESGGFTEEWTVPEDYGGDHRLELRTVDGTTLAQTTLTITPWFELESTQAPLGGIFEITGYGLGPNMVTNNYQIAWDNGMVGFMTGTMNRGTATAQIRAVGPVGEHILQVWRNLKGVPFLQNNTQSPFGPVAGERQSVWSVEVTEPETEPDPVWMDPLVRETPFESHYPELDTESEAELSITPTYGQPGTTTFIRGENFPPETTVDLVWYTHSGNRIAGDPIKPVARPDVLPKAESYEEGRFEIEVEIPNGMGATRPIVAMVNGQSVAVTGFMLQPKIIDFTPTSGPQGTTIDIELTGVGWPKYENSLFFVYDNKPLGYMCGLDMEEDEGIVRTQLQAAGDPGYHFIDVYPSFFEIKEDLPNFEQKAHLSYRDNHPMRSLPAIHFAFEITE